MKPLVTRTIRSFAPALLFAAFFLSAIPVSAARGVPTAVSYQGTLADSGGNPLGGTGTQYYFRFSFWDSATVGQGTRVWPLSAPASVPLLVRQGSFNVDIGGTGYPDVLDYDFSANSSVYLQVEVSPDGSSFETLSPRSAVTSSPFARVASRVSGLGQSAFGTTSPFASSIITSESTSSSVVALTLFGAAGQTANIFDIFAFDGSSLFSVGADGRAASVGFNAASSNSWIGYTNGGNYLRGMTYFGLNDTSVLDSNTGNVGIGTTSPSSSLQIAGATGITMGYNSAQYQPVRIYADTSDNLVITSATSAGKTVSINGLSISSGLSMTGVSASVSPVAFTHNPSGGGSGAPALSVAGTNSQTSGSWNGIRIAQTYNQLSGTAANTDLLINRTQTAVGSGAQYLIDAQVGTVSRFNVTSDGNVGVGTSTPSARLSVTSTGTTTGTAFAVADSNNSSKLTLLDNGQLIVSSSVSGGSGSTAANSGVTFRGNTGAGIFAGMGGSNRLALFAENQLSLSFQQSTMMVLNGFGLSPNLLTTQPQVGVYQDVPGVLKVTTSLAASSLGGLRVASINPNGGNLAVGTSTASASFSIQAGFGSTTPLFDVATTTSSAFATSSLFRVDANGNVGIATSTPNSALSVVGTTTVNTRLVLPPTATAGIQLFNVGDSDGLATNERAGIYWSGNQLQIATERGGGTSRSIAISATDGTIGSARNIFRVFPRGTGAGTAGLFDFSNSSTVAANGTYYVNIANPGGNGWTTSSGDNRMVSILPIYATTGTSQNTDLLIRRTETTVGTGAQNIILAGTSTHAGMFTLQNTGLIGLGTSTMASNVFTTLDGGRSNRSIGLQLANSNSVYNAGQLRINASSTSYTDFFQGSVSGVEGMNVNLTGTSARFNLLFGNSASSYFDTDGWVIRNGGTGNGQIVISRATNQMLFKNSFNSNRAVIGTNGAVDAPGMMELMGVDSVKTVSINATTTSFINGGNLGLGTTTPGAQLTTTGTVRFAALTGAGSNLIVDALGNVTVSSDERLKDVSGQFTRGLADVRRLSPITYHWKAETGYDTASAYTGFSAQNVQSAIPEAVATSASGYLNLADRPIIAAVVNAVKELDLKISSLTDGTAELVVRRIKAGELCLDDVCISKDQLRDLLNRNVVGSSLSAPASPAAPEPVVVTEATSTTPVIEPAPAPEPVAPEPAPEPEAPVGAAPEPVAPTEAPAPEL